MLKPGLSAEVHLTLRVMTGEGRFLGPGRIELLELVGKLGSINKAAAQMKMSYKKAWSLIHQMNEMCREPLVTSKSGGEEGGGTVLTAYGEQVIQKYRQIENEINHHVATIF